MKKNFYFDSFPQENPTESFSNTEATGGVCVLYVCQDCNLFIAVNFKVSKNNKKKFLFLSFHVNTDKSGRLSSYYAKNASCSNYKEHFVLLIRSQFSCSFK